MPLLREPHAPRRGRRDLPIVASAALGLLATHASARADAWDELKKNCRPNARLESAGQLLPDGVDPRRVYDDDKLKEKKLDPADFARLDWKVERESIRDYEIMPRGTPFIGVADLSNGMIYLHPAPLTVELKPEVPAGDDDTEELRQIQQGLPASFRTRLTQAWLGRLEPPERAKWQVGQTVYIAPGKYGENQYVRSLFKPNGGYISTDDFLTETSAENVKFMRHSIPLADAGSTRRFGVYVYHNRQATLVSDNDVGRIYKGCQPGAEQYVSSHECLLEMLGLDWNKTAFLGFSITKRDRNYCTHADLDSIGELNGLYFSGTSKSQNDSVYKDKGGALSEADAKKIYNVLTAALHIPPVAACEAPRVEGAPPAPALTIQEGGEIDIEPTLIARGMSSKRITCTWRKGGDVVPGFRGSPCRFRKTNVTPQDDATYQLTASSGKGAPLVVDYVRHVTARPVPTVESIEVAVYDEDSEPRVIPTDGDGVTEIVVPAGTPVGITVTSTSVSATSSWLRRPANTQQDGDPIDDTEQLYINDFQAQNAGEYRVRITNSSGSATSRWVRLRLR